jgi:DNA-binding transcriptional ArsR family regulator
LSKRRDPFAGLADPTRRAILELLRDHGTLTAGEIAASFPAVTRPAVSKHLRVLRETSLVTAEEHGREWRYQLDAAPLRKVYAEWLESFAPLWEESLARLKRQVEGDRRSEPRSR